MFLEEANRALSETQGSVTTADVSASEPETIQAEADYELEETDTEPAETDSEPEEIDYELDENEAEPATASNGRNLRAKRGSWMGSLTDRFTSFKNKFIA